MVFSQAQVTTSSYYGILCVLMLIQGNHILLILTYFFMRTKYVNVLVRKTSDYSKT